LALECDLLSVTGIQSYWPKGISTTSRTDWKADC